MNTPTLITASKVSSAKSKYSPEGHLAQFAIDCLAPGRIEHPQRQIDPMEVVVVGLDQTLADEAGANARIEYLGTWRDVIAEQGDGCARRDPLEFLAQIAIVFARPLVVAFLEFAVVLRRVYPLHAVSTLLHGGLLVPGTA
ncbi:MAG: hypothetical protein OXH09_17000 [Gammaproteobacteria bacterium]|nr:hypothetical protein [Gammaproteobacteria bacterium]